MKMKNRPELAEMSKTCIIMIRDPKRLWAADGMQFPHAFPPSRDQDDDHAARDSLLLQVGAHPLVLTERN